jgi:hypothetical protein
LKPLTSHRSVFKWVRHFSSKRGTVYFNCWLHVHLAFESRVKQLLFWCLRDPEHKRKRRVHFLAGRLISISTHTFQNPWVQIWHWRAGWGSIHRSLWTATKIVQCYVSSSPESSHVFVLARCDTHIREKKIYRIIKRNSISDSNQISIIKRSVHLDSRGKSQLVHKSTQGTRNEHFLFLSQSLCTLCLNGDRFTNISD